MPIKNLTNTVKAAFPRLGKLRKGGAAPRDQQGRVTKMGADLSYFRFVSDRPEVEAAFTDAYGEQPAVINAFLPYRTVDENFECWKETWSAGGLKHRCDGETMTIWQDEKGEYQRTPKPCTGGCDEVGRLSLIIPELLRAGFVGYVVLETHGINDLLSIQASLMAAADARIQHPLGLRGIPWNLRRVKEKISTPAGNGKRARREKWLVKLEPAADWVQLQLTAAHNQTMMLPAGTEPAEEPEVRNIDRDTGEIFDTVAEEIPDEAPEDAVEEIAPDMLADRPPEVEVAPAALPQLRGTELRDELINLIGHAADIHDLRDAWTESQRHFRRLGDADRVLVQQAKDRHKATFESEPKEAAF